MKNPSLLPSLRDTVGPRFGALGLITTVILLTLVPGVLASTALDDGAEPDSTSTSTVGTLEPSEPGIIGGPTGGFDCILDDGTFCNGEFQNGCVYTTTCPRAKLDQCVPYPLCSEATALR